MRVSKEKAAENRTRILTEAARLFRERGLSGVGVDALTEAAGLTHGSLYSQFGSKERLAAEALAHALASSPAHRISESEEAALGSDLARFVSRYLSARHRDAPGSGCALAALGCEVPRQGPAVRQAFTRGLRAIVARLVAVLPARKHQAPEDEALAVVATLVGGLILARAVDDTALSDRILAACTGHLTDDASPCGQHAQRRAAGSAPTQPSRGQHE
jgi:TetR/AcrR family transcriptional repressor of nem operon